MQIKKWPDVAFWQELVSASPASMFYHTPLWHDIVTAAYPDYAVATTGFIFDDGSRALVPFIQT